MCVCVCVFLDLWMLCIYVERCFESLICCLDLWLSSLLVPFIFMCFSSLEKTFFFKLDSFSTDSDRSSTDSFLSSPSFSFLDRSSIDYWSIKISRFLLNRISIASWSIEENFWALYLPDSISTDPRSIEISGFLFDIEINLFLSTDPRQQLDRLSSVEI